MEVAKGLRYRIQVSTSVKGVKTWEAVVDGEGFNQEDILNMSDMLVAELDRRYPAQTGG